MLGGKCSLFNLLRRFRGTDEAFLRKHFKIDENKARQQMSMVSKRPSADQVKYDHEVLCHRIAKHLIKRGGAGSLHQICLRFSVKKSVLLAHENGTIFEERDGELRLRDGLLRVANAAVSTGAATLAPGRRTSPNELLTSQGVAVDSKASRRLLWRIEGLLTTAGDGSLSLRAVCTALGLRSLPKLRRWCKRNRMRVGADGNLHLDKERLGYFQVHRAISVAALLAEEGVAPIQAAMAMIHRPPEITALEDEERSRKKKKEGKKQQALDMKREDQVEEAQVEESEPEPSADTLFSEDDLNPPPAAIQRASDFPVFTSPPLADQVEEVKLPDLPDRAQNLRPPGGGFGNEEIHNEVNDPEWAWWAHPLNDQPDTIPASLSLALVRPPEWVEAWVRQYFLVSQDGSQYTFADDTQLTWLALSGPKHKPDPLSTKPAGPQTLDEEHALWMKVEEEMRLRYGRCHFTLMVGMFPGLRKSFIKRFYDLSFYDDIVPKSTERQVCEAICIVRNILGSGGYYTAEDAFREYGASTPWLRKYFVVHEDGTLGIDDNVEKKWDPPQEERAPHPMSYSIIKNMPKGFIRKGVGNRKDPRKVILPRKYGHSAGGILY